LTKAHDKLLRGRKLVVTYAHQAPLDQESSGSTSLRHRKTVTEAGRPTTLSLIKAGVNDRRHPRTEDKIALMEAKLRQLGGGSSSSEASTSIAAPVPLHPSLPAKPPPLIREARGSPIGPMRRQERSKIHSPAPLPSLPIIPLSQTPQQSGPLVSSSSSARSRPKLAGVKLLRQKDK